MRSPRLALRASSQVRSRNLGGGKSANKEQPEQVGRESTAGAGEGAGEGEVDSESEAESIVTVGSEPEEEQVKEKEKAKGGEGGSAKWAADNGKVESVAGAKKQRPGVRERWNLIGQLLDSEGAVESPVYGDSSPN